MPFFCLIVSSRIVTAQSVSLDSSIELLVARGQASSPVSMPSETGPGQMLNFIDLVSILKCQLFDGMI